MLYGLVDYFLWVLTINSLADVTHVECYRSVIQGTRQTVREYYAGKFSSGRRVKRSGERPVELFVEEGFIQYGLYLASPRMF